MISPNEHLLAIDRVVERMDERAQYVRLDRNERVTPWPGKTFSEMLATLRPEQFCSYPDPSPLYHRLGATLGIPEDHLYLTNGSDAAIRMAFQTFVRPGDRILQPDPTYAMYPIYTRIFRGEVRAVAYDGSLQLDAGRIFEELKFCPRILAVANPDQPTGAILPEETLRQFAQAALEAGSLFIIDEAYYPFYPHTAIPLVREFENVLVTRTFSKVGGLAGLRLGYMVAQPGVIRHVQRIRGAHEVNAMAIAMGTYVLDHPELTTANLNEIEAGRRVLADACSGLGLELPDCPTNFQLVRWAGMKDTGPLVAALKGKGYLVKGSFSSDCISNCIRVTLAGPEIMVGFVAALREVMAGLSRP
jgi:histidinol-phosphate aminotransferase